MAYGMTVAEKADGNGSVQIGIYVFDPASKTLCRGGEDPARLEDKVALLLELLHAREGDVVSRDEIVAAVWDGRAVSEQTVPVAISKLRKALAEPAGEKPYIETVPKRGYRLRPTRAAEPTGPARGLMWVVSVAALLLIAIGLFWSRDDLSVTPPVAAEKPGIILTLKDIRAPSGKDADVKRAIALSELASYYLSRVPEVLVIRHWWNFDAPDPTGGIFTRYGEDTPVYLIKGTLIDEGGEQLVLLSLSVPLKEEVIWSGAFDAGGTAESYFTLLAGMIEKVGVPNQALAEAGARELNVDQDFWHGRYMAQLSNQGAAKNALADLKHLLAENPDHVMAKNSLAALAARWPDLVVDAPMSVTRVAGDHLSAVDEASLYLFRQRDAARAREALEEALTLAPGDHYALSLLAEAQASAGDVKAALASYEKAMRLAPFARAYGARYEAIQNHGAN